MQLRSTRGVQQEEIWSAADALLAVGQRPTIERVRQHLGRGSPNTVAPMLETWFAGLGKRLGMTEDPHKEGQMPVAVMQAMGKLWDAALMEARKEVEAALAEQRQNLETATAALAARESELASLEHAFSQRQGVVDALLQAEKEKTASVEANLSTAQEQLHQSEISTAALKKAVATAEDQLQMARVQIDAQARQHTVERGRWEERAAGNERRLLGEIDRERLAFKKANAAADEANAALQTTRSNYENRTVALGKQLHASELEFGISQHALQLSERRCAELTGLLQEQRTTNSVTLERLSQTLATLASKRGLAKRKANTVAGKKASSQGRL